MVASTTAPTPAQSRAARVAAVEAASNAKEWPRAAELWDGLRADFPQDARCWHRAGAAYCHAGMFEEAERILGEAVARFPEDEWTAFWLIAVARRRGDWPEALRRAEKMRRDIPGSWRPWLQGADALARLGRQEESDEMRR